MTEGRESQPGSPYRPQMWLVAGVVALGLAVAVLVIVLLTRAEGNTAADASTTTRTVPPCTAAALSHAVGGQIEGNPVTVEHFECAGDFASALMAVPELDTLVVFFRSSGEVWELLDYGTGLLPSDEPEIPPDLYDDLSLK